MRSLALSILAIGSLAFAPPARAETRQITTVGYQVSLDRGEVVELANKRKVRVGMRSHATVVDQATREEFSQWCTGEAQLSEAGAPTIEAGYCALLADDGDVLWVSYFVSDPQRSQWTVIGGTGRYAGATGAGTAKLASERSDGYAWTLTSTGTLTTK
jgi:hypothetical protein